MMSKIKQNHPKSGLEAAVTFLTAEIKAMLLLTAGRGGEITYSEEIRDKKYV